MTVAPGSTTTQEADADSAHAARLVLGSSSLGCVLASHPALLDPTAGARNRVLHYFAERRRARL
jgi:hypothetical protein